MALAIHQRAQHCEVLVDRDEVGARPLDPTARKQLAQAVPQLQPRPNTGEIIPNREPCPDPRKRLFDGPDLLDSRSDHKLVNRTPVKHPVGDLGLIAWLFEIEVKSDMAARNVEQLVA